MLPGFSHLGSVGIDIGGFPDDRLNLLGGHDAFDGGITRLADFIAYGNHDRYGRFNNVVAVGGDPLDLGGAVGNLYFARKRKLYI